MKVALCRIDEIPSEGNKPVEFFGREVLVYQVDGRPRAIMNACLHIGGPMEQKGDCFVCQWHGARYNASDGKKTDGPGRPDARLMFLPTRVEDGILFYVWQE